MKSRVPARVERLTRQHGVFKKDVMGAYDTQPLRSTEYLFHEVAHWLVLGNPIDKLPRRLSAKVSKTFENIPTASSDSLEIDTALVTFVAGYMLGLWTDPSPIVRTCRRNLKSAMALGDDYEVLMKFRSHWVSSKGYGNLARKLALWFKPSAKSKLLPCDSLHFGV